MIDPSPQAQRPGGSLFIVYRSVLHAFRMLHTHATMFNERHCFAMPCTTLQSLRCNTLHYATIPCTTLQYAAVPCTMLQ